MWISEAAAQTAATPAAGGGMLMQLAPLILIFVVFYFLLIRPQQRKMREHREMLRNIRRGDRVVTGGGIIGTVVKVDETKDPVEAQVEIAENTRVRVLQSTITTVLARTEPVRAEGATASADSAPAPAPEERRGLGRFLRR